MREIGTYASSSALFVVATLITQIPTSKSLSVASAFQQNDSGLMGRRLVETYTGLPLAFEANQGQTDHSVKFLSRGSSYTLFLTSTEAVLRMQRSGFSQSRAREGADGTESVDEKSKEGAVLRMKLVEANLAPEVTGLEELPGKSNYFIGNDPSKWRTNVPNYAKVGYENVYPGIDLIYYGNQRFLEYDFRVAPGADPQAIRLAFLSGDSDSTVPLRIDSPGDLVLEVEGNELRLHQPIIYQEINGARKRIGGSFVIKNENEVGFEVARYDASKPLIIDPVLTYSTYLGGNSIDNGYGIAVDSANNAYVTGYTRSANFPTANAFQAAWGGCTGSLCFDAFVTKLNASGSALVYSTYLGGSSDDSGYGIAVDSSGNAYVTGQTLSSNFPTANAFQGAFAGGSANGDVFVTKLNASGSALVYSTYLGGNSEDSGRGIAVDSSGNASVTGFTGSNNFPTANAGQPAYAGTVDAFIAKLTPAGSGLVYSTYLGSVGSDLGNGIAVDSSGNAYVTGIYLSCGPACGHYTFVVKVSPSGSTLIYSNILGGDGTATSHAIAVDSSGNAYVAGETISPFFPTTPGAFQPAASAGLGGYYNETDAFVIKINAAGSALVYSTYLGGSGIPESGVFGDDRAYGIAVDSSGNAYITGYTSSRSFPTANAFQAENGGSTDAFVTELNTTGSALVYSTYLGGSFSDFSYGIAVEAGSAYVTGYTTSSNFAKAGAFQTTYGGTEDAFVTKISPPTPPGTKRRGQVTSE